MTDAAMKFSSKKNFIMDFMNDTASEIWFGVRRRKSEVESGVRGEGKTECETRPNLL